MKKHIGPTVTSGNGASERCLKTLYSNHHNPGTTQEERVHCLPGSNIPPLLQRQEKARLIPHALHVCVVAEPCGPVRLTSFGMTWNGCESYRHSSHRNLLLQGRSSVGGV